MHVIGMTMGVEHGIEARDFRIHQLCMQVWRCVDQEPGVTRIDQHGDPAPAVAGVRRAADRAVAADHRDSA